MILPRRWHRLDFSALRNAARAPAGLHVTSNRRGPWLQAFVPNGTVYRQAAIPLRDLSPTLAGVRLLHLSDLHLRSYWGRGHDELLHRLRDDPPHLILITGDFIDNKTDHRPALPTVRRLIGHLTARHGVYAILGNHDPNVLRPYLADLGVRFVTGRRILAPLGDRGAIELIGMPGLARHDLDLPFLRSLPPRTPGTPRVVLCHYPDGFPAARNLDPDLYLAGHTHGGQVCLPGGYPIVTHDNMPRRFGKGIHRIGATWFAVSNGFGFTGVPFRAFCPTEVVEFQLVREVEAPSVPSPPGTPGGEG